MTSDWDRLFDELYLQTYAAIQDEDPGPLALGAVRLAHCPDGGDVLDAACGYGRHSVALARAGYRVVGADRSPVLLAEARRRAGEAEWPRWVEADYRELPLEDGSFHAVLNLFTSFGFWGEEGDRQALGEFRRVLRPGGALVMEIQHRDRVMAIFQPRDWHELPGGAALLEERSFDSAAGVITTRHVLWPNGGEPVAVTYELRLYTPGELGELAKQAGFGSVEHFGDLEGAPVSRESRLLLVAEAAS
ncbi:MAG: class I SAM-dependent methyltransferase [Gaiellaceae bacterium]